MSLSQGVLMALFLGFCYGYPLTSAQVDVHWCTTIWNLTPCEQRIYGLVYSSNYWNLNLQTAFIKWLIPR
jgi:hypothetical protein